jgi:hypothetical protein
VKIADPLRPFYFMEAAVIGTKFATNRPGIEQDFCTVFAAD